MEIKDFVTGIQHIGLPCRDIEETRAFYRELGFQEVWTAPHGKLCFLQLQDVMFETYEAGEHAAMAYGAIDHISLNVKDVDKLYEIALEKGFKVVSRGLETLPFWDNGVKFFTIEGPNREKVEFNQYL